MKLLAIALLAFASVSYAQVKDIENTPEARAMRAKEAKELAAPKIGAQKRFEGKGKTEDEAVEKMCEVLVKTDIKYYSLGGPGYSWPQPESGHPYHWYWIYITYNHE